ncbi:skin secretory protein xP2-like [Heterocephalus glaber]|uniref:Skin secretory protein xP2-like n=1 Tax=Heterocephalus glaber TaxID=10181 RepID=A0AAX6PIQ4_HETGA|nr:skin secretory protein xP2-like [Heterocephalus glaber]
MAKSPCFRPLTRNCLAFRSSTGQVSPDPETWGPEMSGSPGKISLDLDSGHSGPPSPGQVQLGPATIVLHFLVELHFQENPPAELLAQLEQAEPTEAQPTGPGPAPAEVPCVEPEPAPPAASCPVLGPQPESVEAPSPAAVLGHPVVARWSMSPPELCLGPGPGPFPLFPSLMLALVLVFTLALIPWIYINNRTSF